MGRGVEMRFPFLWYDLIGLMYHMPMSIRIGDGTTKNILRKVMADILPPEILYRPKSPFALPATRERHYNGAELEFNKPALKYFFWKHHSRVAEALKDGKYQQENMFVDGLIENLLNKQEDFENAYFDHFLWKLWNIAEWYENWIAV